MTNADMIRGMDDDQLGRYLCDLIEECEFCPVGRRCNIGHNAFLEWVREPVEDRDIILRQIRGEHGLYAGEKDTEG